MRSTLDVRILAAVFVLVSPLAHASPKPAKYSVQLVKLSSAPAGGIYMAYLAYDPHPGCVWAPAGNTGVVDVIDSATNKVTPISGFTTKEVDVRGRKRVF